MKDIKKSYHCPHCGADAEEGKINVLSLKCYEVQIVDGELCYGYELSEEELSEEQVEERFYCEQCDSKFPEPEVKVVVATAAVVQ